MALSSRSRHRAAALSTLPRSCFFFFVDVFPSDFVEVVNSQTLKFRSYTESAQVKCSADSQVLTRRTDNGGPPRATWCLSSWTRAKTLKDIRQGHLSFFTLSVMHAMKLELEEG